jgi:hypothetical protein
VLKQVVEESGGYKNGFWYKFSVKAAGKRKSLTVDGDFGKIIDVVGRKLCFFRIYG